MAQKIAGSNPAARPNNHCFLARDGRPRGGGSRREAVFPVQDLESAVSENVSADQAQAPLFIVNPMSGGGRTKRRLGTLIDAIERAGLKAEMVFTTHQGHGEPLAREAIERGRRYLVACGGDGTVYEVANAIIHAGAAETVRLGTIGMGAGKDVAKCLGIGTGAKAIRAIVAGADRRIDVGRIVSRDEAGAEMTRYFVLEASAGWVSEISQSTPTWLKRLGDTAPYVIVTFAKMAGRMGRPFTLTIDGEPMDARYNSISVHNMELWGGNLAAAPGAAPDDGLLDVIRWGDLGRREVMKAVQGQRKGGTHLEIDGVDHHPARVIELSSPKRTRLDLDGEFGGYLPARIDVVPGALRFAAPAS